MKTAALAIAVCLSFGATAACFNAAQAQVSIGLSVNIAPPALPDYDQPPIPEAGYLWTPGYWAWSGDDYYWVPGVWVLPPQPGVLWTPGYWGWGNGGYAFHNGYWGEHVGFYGGVNYGYGYGGAGYQGGYWQRDRFFYNRSVNHITNVNITNVYTKTVINNNNRNQVSYNGGNGGIKAQPTPTQRAAANEHHIEATPQQTQHQKTAASTPAQFLKVNHGAPKVAATAKPGVLEGPGVVAPHTSRANETQRPAPASHPAEHTAAPKPEPRPGERAAGPQAQPRPAERAAAPKPEPRPVEHTAAPKPEPRPAERAATPKPEPRPVEHTAAPKPEPRPVERPAAPKPESRPVEPPHAAAPKPHAEPKPKEEKHPEPPKPQAF